MPSISQNRTAAGSLRQSRAVMEAGVALADALESTRDSGARQREIAAAVEGLQDAAKATDAAFPSRSRFSSNRDGTDEEEPEEMTIDERLSLAASDATMAQVLFAASDAVGERSDGVGAKPLRAALRTADLQQADEKIASAKNFASAPEPFSSGDLEHAVSTFRLQARSALETILKQTDDAVEKIFTSLAKSKSALVDAFSQVGELFEIPPGAAMLFRSAWQKLLSALHGLHDLVEGVSKADRAEDLIELIKAKTVRGGLEHIFHAEDLLHDIDSVQAPAALQWAVVDDLSGRLAAMAGTFESIVANIRRIALVVALVAPIAVAHLTGPFAPLAPLFVPAAYSLAIVAILVVGYDFSHTGRFNTGNGIRELVLKIGTTAEPLPGS